MDNARHYQEVKLQQSRLAQIFDSTSDGMLLVAPDGRVETRTGGPATSWP
jgi:hypothetical protein